MTPTRRASKGKNQVQVIARAVAIMRALEHEQQGLSLGEIAQRVALARSTVQRIVAALEAEKFLIAASPNARVRLGPALLRFAASVRTDFVSLARPFLFQLSNELRETVDLAVIKRGQVVFVDQVVGPERLRTVSAVGESFPLYCTASGKAYLALLSDAAVEKLVGRRLDRRTSNTLTSFAALAADLEQIRKTGVALDHEEHAEGICAAAVALRDVLGNYVAISSPVPTQRFAEREKMIAERLLATKHTIEHYLSASETDDSPSIGRNDPDPGAARRSVGA